MMYVLAVATNVVVIAERAEFLIKCDEGGKDLPPACQEVKMHFPSSYYFLIGEKL